MFTESHSPTRLSPQDIPSLSLSVNTVIDTQLSDEARRQRMAERDHERLTTLAQEREHQRELERHWAQQRVEDKIREEVFAVLLMLFVPGNG